MSWLSGYKAKPSTSSEADLREAKRNKLEADRLLRAQQREKRQKQLQAAIDARREADEVIEEFLRLDPDIFSTAADITEEEANEILAEIMAEPFQIENGTDGEKAMEKLGSIQVPFDKEDIGYWFSQIEGQMEMISVKSQWLKRLAMQRFLPAEIQHEVKSLFRLNKTEAGTDIYARIKAELMELFGQKQEDAFERAQNRVMTGKPSQLGKALIDDLCKGAVKLQGCHCDSIVWGMFRQKLPIVIRNHIAQKTFTKDSYKEIFKIADSVYDSNKGAEPLPPPRQIAATSGTASATSAPAAEVAAVQKPKKNKNKNQNRPNSQNQGQNGGGEKPKPDKAKMINEESLCRIHAKWKKDANFCAAPWGCKMKNIYKEPQ